VPVARRTPVTITPASHIFGLGALVGSTSRFGATARAWRSNGLGFQFGVSRDALSSDVAADRVTSMQFEPALVYALADDVGDYVWARAYVGSSASVVRQTLNLAAPGLPTSDTGLGLRVFGGAELTFASVPQFGLSADVGYRRVPTPFQGFDPKPWSVTIAGHWYVK
jgi:hypothetical protein